MPDTDAIRGPQTPTVPVMAPATSNPSHANPLVTLAMDPSASFGKTLFGAQKDHPLRANW